MRQLLVVSLLIFSALAQPHSACAQGNLNPPGAPAPMFRTLEEVQPRVPIGMNTTPGDTNALFNITQPGSYYLTTNITGVVGKYGIMIAASGVTLDLMGFQLAGVSNSADGVYINAAVFLGSLTNIVVRNGTICDWGENGISCGNFVTGCKFEDLRLTGNGRNGPFSGSGLVFSASGGNHSVIVVNCIAAYNSVNGIAVSEASISGCVAHQNGLFGIVASESVITGCSAFYNGVGIDGTDSTITSCTSAHNNGDGIEVRGHSLVSGNVCNANAVGIHASPVNISSGPGNRIEGNHLARNFRGLLVESAGNLIMRNSSQSSSGGTNYVIVSGNKVGVIVAAPDSGAISGSNGGVGMGTTDPWANFSY